MIRHRATDSVRLVGIVSVAFLVLGMAIAGVGPAMPDLARRSGASPVAAGGALSALYTGALAGQALAGLLLHRLGRRAAMIAGMALVAAGTSGIAASKSLPLLLGSAGCMGLGAGALILAGNVLAAEASAGAGALNLVNAMFGIGAIVSPAIIGGSMKLLGTGLPVFLVTSAAMVATVVLFVLWASQAAARADQAEHGAPVERMGRRGLVRSPFLWAIAAFMFAYQPMESGLSGWLPTLLNRSAALPLEDGALAASWFWLLMTASRLGAAWASRFVLPATMLRACVGLCIVGAALMVGCAAAESQALGLAGATALGLAMGPILPTVLSVVRSSFPDNPGAAAGLALSVGGVSNAVIPWALGATILQIGALAGAGFLLAMPLAFALALALMRPGPAPEGEAA